MQPRCVPRCSREQTATGRRTHATGPPDPPPTPASPALPPAPPTRSLHAYLHAPPPARSLPAPPCPLRAPATRSLRLAALASPQAFLGRLLRGTLHLLQSQHGLTEHENYHELCRLLARLKANYQLSELVQADCYREWISMVASFTIDNELNSSVNQQGFGLFI